MPLYKGYIILLRKYYLATMETSPTTNYYVAEDNALMNNLLLQEIQSSDNPYLTTETLLIRILKRMSDLCQISWPIVVNTIRKGNCLLNPNLQKQLFNMWNICTKHVTFEEQYCMERILGHDFVRQTDLLKLAGCLNKIAEKKQVWTFFAVDGFLGDNPKRYVPDSFCIEEMKSKHAQAVRVMYQELDSPSSIKEALEIIFNRGIENHVYIEIVGGWDTVKQIAEWRREQQQKFEARQK